MDLTGFTPAMLRELITLLEQKEKLTQQIAEIDAKFVFGRSADEAPKSVKPIKGAKVKAPKRAKRGAGSASVLEALAAAGATGISVADLSKKVSVSGAYLNGLLATLVKQQKAQKVSRGIYASLGA